MDTKYISYIAKEEREMSGLIRHEHNRNHNNLEWNHIAQNGLIEHEDSFIILRGSEIPFKAVGTKDDAEEAFEKVENIKRIPKVHKLRHFYYHKSRALPNIGQMKAFRCQCPSQSRPNGNETAQLESARNR